MLRLASDADVHGEIIRGLRRRLPEILLIAEYMPEEEIRDQVVVFLPFKG
jgi:hypothetical protein